MRLLGTIAGIALEHTSTYIGALTCGRGHADFACEVGRFLGTLCP